MNSPKIRFRIDFAERNNLGPGKIALLEAVRATGSISDAARTLGMSYRRAWLLLSSLNAAFDQPVTVAVTGGKGGGGARLTPFGAELIAAYRDLEIQIVQLAAEKLAAILPHAAAVVIAAPGPGRRPLSKKPSDPRS